MDPRNGFVRANIIPSALLEEMIGVIIDLYPGHPCIPKAQAILDGKMSDLYSRHVHMAAKLNLMTHLNKVDVNLGSITGRPVELPGTIEAVPSAPATEKEVEAELTGADKWHRCIKAKLQRSDDVLNRAIKYYDLSSRELYAKLNTPSSLPNPTFTLQGLYWVFESSPGYWEDVWENCFGCKIC